MLLRLQRTYRRVKPDESPAFIHHLLLHQCIIIQQRTHMGWRLNWGQDFLVPAQTWAPSLWFLPAEDFASPLLSDVWCQTSHEAYPAFSPQEWYFFSSLIAEYLRLGSLKKQYFTTAAALSNQGEISKQLQMSWSESQTHRDWRKSIQNCTPRYSLF